MTGNEELVQELISSGYLRTPLIIEAFRKIDRRDFVLNEYKDEAYGNYPLPIGFNQTISQPLTVAFMLELLGPEPGDRVLEIGAGSGWVTALLAYIVSDGGKRRADLIQRPLGIDLDFVRPKLFRPGRVVAIERIPELRDTTMENVGRYEFIKKKLVQVVLGDGSKGYVPEAPYTKIIAAAAGEKIPVAWKNQCRIGGKIVTPIEDVIEVHEKMSGSDYMVKEYAGFRFVPLVVGDGGL